MLPSASLPGLTRTADAGAAAIYEPVHGSAPDLTDLGMANPIGAILSVAMMFEFSFHQPAVARAIEQAVDRTVQHGTLTPDLGGQATTEQVTEQVLTHLAQAD
jgi:3-isopropylmalate dehydrogenase